MLQIETSGSWRDMGRQIGEAFREKFEPVAERFAPWLRRDPGAWRGAIAAVRATVAEHAPHLLEETSGMAEALSYDADFMLGLRFSNELRHFEVGCSGVFVADGAEGPLLGRTCDIEPDLSAEIQICRLCRPDKGPATITVTYLHLTGGVGINEHGLALTGSSASAKGPSATAGLPSALFNTLVMQRCATVEDVATLAALYTLRGKGAVQLVCDATGASALLELYGGHKPIVTRRQTDRTWQACANFCVSPGFEVAAGPAYVGNAYMRYGRIAHQLEEGRLPRNADGIKRLLTDVAQPGMLCEEQQCHFHTAYAFVAEPAARKLHLAPGHPAKTHWKEYCL